MIVVVEDKDDDVVVDGNVVVLVVDIQTVGKDNVDNDVSLVLEIFEPLAKVLLMPLFDNFDIAPVADDIVDGFVVVLILAVFCCF